MIWKIVVALYIYDCLVKPLDIVITKKIVKKLDRFIKDHDVDKPKSVPNKPIKPYTSTNIGFRLSE